MNAKSNESIIGAQERAVKARSVRRKPDAEKWNADMVMGVKGSDAHPDPSNNHGVIPNRIDIRIPEAKSNGMPNDKEPKIIPGVQ